MKRLRRSELDADARRVLALLQEAPRPYRDLAAVLKEKGLLETLEALKDQGLIGREAGSDGKWYCRKPKADRQDRRPADVYHNKKTHRWEPPGVREGVVNECWWCGMRRRLNVRGVTTLYEHCLPGSDEWLPGLPPECPRRNLAPKS